MSGFGVYILALAGGYIFATRWLGSKLVAATESGYKVVFRAVRYGAVLYLQVAIPLFIAAKLFPSVDLAIAWFEVDFATVAALGAFLLGMFAWPLMNLGRSRKDALYAAVDAEGAVMERLLLDSVYDEDLVMLDVSSRKVYIGFVREISDPGARARAVALLPVITGYRDEQTLRFEPTTRYFDAFRSAGGEAAEVGDPAVEAFRIVLPLDTIRAARLWRPESVVGTGFDQEND